VHASGAAILGGVHAGPLGCDAERQLRLRSLAPAALIRIGAFGLEVNETIFLFNILAC